MAITHDDSDIKIFGSAEETADSEFLRQIEALDHHRQNGNMEKALTLGKKLYTIIVDESTRDEIKDPDFMEGKLYIKTGVLALFAAEAALNMYLPSSQLSTIAISEMHRLLAKIGSPVYAKILESPAYSFYSLTLRKGGDVSEEIGKAFAEHCRHEGDEKYIAEGKYIFERVIAEVRHQIDKLDFAE